MPEEFPARLPSTEMLLTVKFQGMYPVDPFVPVIAAKLALSMTPRAPGLTPFASLTTVFAVTDG